MLFVLVDRDRIVRHLLKNAQPGEPRLALDATKEQIVTAVLRTSDAPDKLRVFLLQPNMEGLLAAIEQCAPRQWTGEIASARGKDRLARDFVLTEVAKAAMATVRACVRTHQPGLSALAKAVAELLPREAIA